MIRRGGHLWDWAAVDRLRHAQRRLSARKKRSARRRAWRIRVNAVRCKLRATFDPLPNIAQYVERPTDNVCRHGRLFRSKTPHREIKMTTISGFAHYAGLSPVGPPRAIAYSPDPPSKMISFRMSSRHSANEPRLRSAVSQSLFALVYLLWLGGRMATR
jgi:hypothetical protein